MVGIQKAFFPHEQLQYGINVFVLFFQIWNINDWAHLNKRDVILSVQILEVTFMKEKSLLNAKLLFLFYHENISNVKYKW